MSAWIPLNAMNHAAGPAAPGQQGELERSRLELQQLSASLVEAREEERRRIARELHDELGQQLSALKMEVSSLTSAPHSALQAERFKGMLEMIDETVASVRRIAADLRPLMLDDLGLNAAVEWLARMSSRRMGIQITLRLGEYPEPLPERASIALYRMVQEALTNIARHANASEALIEIRHVGEQLWLTVEDNGVGFRPHSMRREGSHGLMGMRERAHMLGGSLEIGSAETGGGRIRVCLPLEPQAPGPAPAAEGA
ncbi:MAG TPA: sensor histidine kinase [Ideonella sp.]|nr:sensor histidine kinase [Ideonella sp.]